MLLDFVKAFAPGSLWLLLLIATIAVALLFLPWPRAARIGRLTLAMTVAIYWLFTLPAVSGAIMRGYPAIETPRLDPATRAHVGIVVIGAGILTYRAGGEEITAPSPASAFNVLAGSQLYRSLDHPLVIVTGGVPNRFVQHASEADVLAAELRQFGVDDDRLILERASTNTYTQAINVAAIAKAHALQKLVIVTSPAHLRRAVPAFRAQSVDAISYPASFLTEQREPLAMWRPTPFSSDLAREALYDYLGWAYYRARGWLSAPE